MAVPIYPNSSIAWKEETKPLTICRDCGSFRLSLSISSVYSDEKGFIRDASKKYHGFKEICVECNGTNIIPFPEYLPVEQGNRYVEALKKRQKNCEGKTEIQASSSK
jgi:hypothetical protein